MQLPPQNFSPFQPKNGKVAAQAAVCTVVPVVPQPARPAQTLTFCLVGFSTDLGHRCPTCLSPQQYFTFLNKSSLFSIFPANTRAGVPA